MENKLLELLASAKSVKEYSILYCDYITSLLSNLDHDKIEKITHLFFQAVHNKKFVYFLGNGGSATTATHFACDFSKGTKNKKFAMRALALADNLGTFTAYANDEGYDFVFSKQLENVLNNGDIVVMISASGNSSNLIEAAKMAKKHGAHVISFLGFDGGKLKDLSDEYVVIETRKGEYAPVEDIHLILNHIISTYITHAAFAKYMN